MTTGQSLRMARCCNNEYINHSDNKTHLLTKPTGAVAASTINNMKGKGKVLPYSLPSIGPGADPSVQAVSPYVTT